MGSIVKFSPTLRSGHMRIVSNAALSTFQKSVSQGSVLDEREPSGSFVQPAVSLPSAPYGSATSDTSGSAKDERKRRLALRHLMDAAELLAGLEAEDRRVAWLVDDLSDLVVRRIGTSTRNPGKQLSQLVSRSPRFIGNSDTTNDGDAA